MQLVQISTELEWHIAIPAADLNQMVEGIIMGTEPFIRTVAESINNTELKYLETEELVQSQNIKRKKPTSH